MIYKFVFKIKWNVNFINYCWLILNKLTAFFFFFDLDTQYSHLSLWSSQKCGKIGDMILFLVNCLFASFVSQYLKSCLISNSRWNSVPLPSAFNQLFSPWFNLFFGNEMRSPFVFQISSLLYNLSNQGFYLFLVIHHSFRSTKYFLLCIFSPLFFFRRNISNSVSEMLSKK